MASNQYDMTPAKNGDGSNYVSPELKASAGSNASLPGANVYTTQGGVNVQDYSGVTPTGGSFGADGSYTGANGQSYSSGQVGIIRNAMSNNALATSYWLEKYGGQGYNMGMDTFGMPASVENGTQQDVRNWVDSLHPSSGGSNQTPPSGAGAVGPQTSGTQTSGIISSATSSGGSGGYKPWNVTPQQTVEGRISSIMNPNNPIIAMARSDAVDQMNARGLANSSLATSAADRAAYEAAIPIAQQDAATAAKAAGYNSDIQNQMSMQGRQLASQEGIAQLQANTQRDIAKINADTQRYTAQLDASTRTQVQQMQNDNQKLLQTNQNAAQAFNQSMVAIANIEQNNTMDAAAKTAAIAQIMQNLQMQLHTIGTVANIDLGGTLDFRNMPGFDANGKWVGLSSSSNSPASAPSTPPMAESLPGDGGSSL